MRQSASLETDWPSLDPGMGRLGGGGWGTVAAHVSATLRGGEMCHQLLHEEGADVGVEGGARAFG